MGQQVRLWKAMNLMKHAAKLAEVMAERGLSPDQVRHLGFAEAVPLIEAASYEESDEVQELWAKLLASALDPASSVSVEKPFVGILRQVGAVEASILSFVSTVELVALRRVSGPDAVTILEMHDRLLGEISQKAVAAGVLNLRRLGCISPLFTPPDTSRLVDEDILGRTIGVNAAALTDALSDLMFNVADGLVTDALPEGPLLKLPKHEMRLPVAGLYLTELGDRLMDAVNNKPATAAE